MRQWLIDTRKEKAMTQHEVAKLAGISQPSLHEFETGKATPKPETAKKISKVLGFHWTRFYEEEEP